MDECADAGRVQTYACKDDKVTCICMMKLDALRMNQISGEDQAIWCYITTLIFIYFFVTIAVYPVSMWAKYHVWSKQ